VKHLLQSISPSALISGKHRSISGLAAVSRASRHRHSTPALIAVSGHYRSMSGATAVNSPTKGSWSPPLIKVRKQSNPANSDPYGLEDASLERVSAGHNPEAADEVISFGTKPNSTKVEQQLDTIADELEHKESVNQSLLYASQRMQQKLDKIASKGVQTLMSEQNEMLGEAKAENNDLTEGLSALKHELAIKDDLIVRGLTYIKSHEREWRSALEVKKALQTKQGQEGDLLDLLEKYNEDIADLQAQLDGRNECNSSMHQLWPSIQKTMVNLRWSVNEKIINLLEDFDKATSDLKAEVEFLRPYHNGILQHNHNQLVNNFNVLRQEYDTFRQDHDQVINDFDVMSQNYRTLQQDHNRLVTNFNNLDRDYDNLQQRVLTLWQENTNLLDQGKLQMEEHDRTTAEKAQLRKEKDKLEQEFYLIEQNLGNFGGRAFVRVIHLVMQLENMGLNATDQEHKELSVLARNLLKINEVDIRQVVVAGGEDHDGYGRYEIEGDNEKEIDGDISGQKRSCDEASSEKEANNDIGIGGGGVKGANQFATNIYSGQDRGKNGERMGTSGVQGVPGVGADRSQNPESPYTRNKRLFEEKEAETLERLGLKFEKASRDSEKPGESETIVGFNTVYNDTEPALGMPGTRYDENSPRTRRGLSYSQQDPEDTDNDVQESGTPLKVGLAYLDEVAPARIGGTSGISRADFQEATNEIRPIAKNFKHLFGVSLVTKNLANGVDAVFPSNETNIDSDKSKAELTPPGEGAAQTTKGTKEISTFGRREADDLQSHSQPASKLGFPPEAIEEDIDQTSEGVDAMYEIRGKGRVISVDATELSQGDMNDASPAPSAETEASNSSSTRDQRTPAQQALIAGNQSSPTSSCRLKAFNFGEDFGQHVPEEAQPPIAAKARRSSGHSLSNEALKAVPMNHPSLPQPESSTLKFDAGQGSIAASQDSAVPSSTAVQAEASGAGWSSDFFKKVIEPHAAVMKEEELEIAKEEKNIASKRNREAKRAAAAAELTKAELTGAKTTAGGMTKRERREKLKELKKASRI